MVMEACLVEHLRRRSLNPGREKTHHRVARVRRRKKKEMKKKPGIIPIVILSLVFKLLKS